MDNDAKRILVAGGAGFIGSHLCERLLREGHTIECVDNYSTGSRENIAHLRSNERFTARHHDITAPVEVTADEVYNLGCPASPVHYQRDPVQTLRSSVLGTLNLLRLAQDQGATLLLASTSEVYGDPQIHPQREDYCGHVNPIGPRACYDEGKRCAETLCFDYRRQYRVAIKVARIFNTYGPRMQLNDGRVVSNFIVQALRDKPITIYGDGTQTRSFCYVDDLVDALVRLMHADSELSGPVNLGNPQEIAMVELAEHVLRLTRSRSRITYRKLPNDDPARRKPDITRAQTMFGWSPTVDLEAGLVRTIHYFGSMLGRKQRLWFLPSEESRHHAGERSEAHDAIKQPARRHRGDGANLP